MSARSFAPICASALDLVLRRRRSRSGSPPSPSPAARAAASIVTAALSLRHLHGHRRHRPDVGHHRSGPAMSTCRSRPPSALAGAVAMKVMDGQDSLILLGLLAALGCGCGGRRVQLSADPGCCAFRRSSPRCRRASSCSRRHRLWPRPPHQAAAAARRLHHRAGTRGVPLASRCMSCSRRGGGRRRSTARSTAARSRRSARTCAPRWLAGLPVERLRFLTYVLCGAARRRSAASCWPASRGGPRSTWATEYLLASIAVVVIGGTSVAGGRANVPGIWGARCSCSCWSRCSTPSAPAPASAWSPPASSSP